jgi:hypothetical protein
VKARASQNKVSSEEYEDEQSGDDAGSPSDNEFPIHNFFPKMTVQG